jgi:hypothetical protein
MNTRAPETLEYSTFRPPKHEIESFARCIFPAIQTYFESKEGQREFAEWKAAKQEQQ